MVGNLCDMQWQYQWAGTQLVNQNALVHADELDQPQEQLRALILPSDPMPLMNARPENYAMDEQTRREEIGGQLRLQIGGIVRLESNLQSGNTQQ